MYSLNVLVGISSTPKISDGFDAVAILFYQGLTQYKVFILCEGQAQIGNRSHSEPLNVYVFDMF